MSTFGIPKTQIFVAPNAVDNNLFRTQGARVRELASEYRQSLQLPAQYFLNVGRLIAAKGVFDLLDAYAKLDLSMRSRISLLFVGDGVAREELKAGARAITPGSIQFRGFVQRDDLAPFYALADALVFPTHSDTWGFVVNESMASGTPVIASKVAGCVADLVRDSETGLTVPARDSSSLARCMTFLTSNPELRAQLGHQASDLIANYSPEACATGIASAARAVAHP